MRQEGGAGGGDDVNHDDGDVDEGNVMERLHGAGEQGGGRRDNKAAFAGKEMGEDEGPGEEGARSEHLDDDGGDGAHGHHVGNNMAVAGKEGQSLHYGVRRLPFAVGENAEEECGQQVGHVRRVLAGEVTDGDEGDGAVGKRVVQKFAADGVGSWRGGEGGEFKAQDLHGVVVGVRPRRRCGCGV